jgi:hypothetical protein
VLIKGAEDGDNSADADFAAVSIAAVVELMVES